MAFIQKLQNNRAVSYRVHYKDPSTNQRRCKSFPRYKDAQAFLESAKISLSGERHDVTVAAAIDHWLEVCRTTGRNGREPVARSTYKKYEAHAQFLKGVNIEVDGSRAIFGDIILSRLAPAHCQALRNSLIADMSWIYARKHMTSLKGVLAQARADALMTHEPAEFVFIRPPSRAPIYDLRDDEKVPQLDEIQRILRTMRMRLRIKKRDLRRQRLRYKLIFETIAFGGTRPGEALGLAWTDVLFERGGIRITQDVDDDGTIGALKSKSAYRFIAMPERYMRQLRWWRMLCPKSALNLVFPNWSGKVEFLSNLNRRGWQPILLEAGVVTPQGRHKYPPKSLRHARASMEIEKGANPNEIKSLMGHSTIKVTYDVYGHLFEAHTQRRQQRANDVAADMLGSSRSVE